MENRLYGKLIRYGVVVAAALLAFAIIVSAAFAPSGLTGAVAQPQTINSGTMGTIANNTFPISFSSTTNWTDGFTYAITPDVGNRLSGGTGGSYTFNGSTLDVASGSGDSLTGEPAHRYVIFRFELDDTLTALAKAGALQAYVSAGSVRINDTCWSVGRSCSQGIKIYYADSALDDYAYFRLKNNSAYDGKGEAIDDASDGVGASYVQGILNDTVTESNVTCGGIVKGKYIYFSFGVSRTSAVGQTSSIQISNISVKFRVKSDLYNNPGNYLPAEYSSQVNTLVLSNVRTSTAAVSNAYDFTRPQENGTPTIGTNNTVECGSVATLDLTTPNRSGYTLSFTGNYYAGFGSVVSGDQISEKVLFDVMPYGGTKETDLNIDQLIAKGYADGGGFTMSALANSMTGSVNFTMNGTVDMKIYNAGNKYATIRINLANYDRSVPTNAAFEGGSDWHNTQSFNLFSIPADGNWESIANASEVRYYYAMGFSNESFDKIDETRITFQKGQYFSYGDGVSESGKLMFKYTAQYSGYYKFKVIAVDKAGNISDASEIYSVKVDFAAPQFSLDMNIEGLTGNQSIYASGSWINKNIVLTAKNKPALSVMPSGATVYMMTSEVDLTDEQIMAAGEAEWKALVGDTDTLSTDSLLINHVYFKAVSGSGNVFYLRQGGEGTAIMDNLVLIDKSAPDNFGADLLVSETTDWDTNVNWEKTASAVYEDVDYPTIGVSGVGYGDGLTVNYKVQIHNGAEYVDFAGNVYDFSLQNNGNGLANNLAFDLSSDGVGGLKKLIIWITDQAGNQSATLEYEFKMDGNRYTIAYEIGTNVYTEEEGGTLRFSQASYARNETVSGSFRADNQYVYDVSDSGRLAQFTTDGTSYSDLAVSENNGEYSFSFTISDVDPQKVNIKVFFKKEVVIYHNRTPLTYNKTEQIPSITDNFGLVVDGQAFGWDNISLIADYVITAAGSDDSVSPVNAGSYEITYTPKQNDWLKFRDQSLPGGEVNVYTYSINAKTLDLVATPATSVYGDPDAPLAFEIKEGQALCDGDSFTGTLERAAGSDVGAYKVNIGTVTVNDGNGGNNYVLVLADNTAYSITRRPVTVGLASDTRVYDGLNILIGYTVTEGNVVGEETLDIAFMVASVNAGTHSVYAVTKDGSSSDFAVNNPNYNITIQQGLQYVITPAEITLIYADKSMVYGDTEPAAELVVEGSAFTLTEGVDYTVSGLEREPGVTVGTYNYLTENVTVEMINANFSFTEVKSGTLTISAKDLTVSAKAEGDTVYGGTFGLKAVFDGLIASDSEAVSAVEELKYLRKDVVAVAAGLIEDDAPDAAFTDAVAVNDIFKNYNISYNIVYTINKRVAGASVATSVFSIPEGSTEINITISDVGLSFTNVLEADAEQFNATFTYSFTASDGSDVTAFPEGNYILNIVPGTAFADNYEFDNSSFVIVVGNAKIVVISISGNSKTYDGMPLEYSLSYTSDDAPLNVTAPAITIDGKPAFDIIAAGTYSLTVTVDESIDGQAYFGRATFTINIAKRDLTVGVSEKSFVYGFLDADDIIDTTVSGALAEHSVDVTAKLDFTGIPEVGSYSLVYQINVKDGQSNDVIQNYNVIYASSSVSVTPAALTVTAKSGSGIYGDISRNIQYTVSGWQFDDADKNLLKGAFGLDTDAAFPAPANYGVVVATPFTAGNNYTVTANTASAIFTVNPKTIVLSASDVFADNKTYDGNNTVYNSEIYISDYRVGGDDLGVTYSVVYSTVNAGTGTVSAVFSNIALTGSTASRYILVIDGEGNTIVKTGLTIYKASVVIDKNTFTVSVSDIIYSGTNVIANGNISVVNNSLPAGITYTYSGRYASKNITYGGEKAAITFVFDMKGWNQSDNMDIVITEEANVIEDNSTSTILRVIYYVDYVIEKKPVNISTGSIIIGDKVFDNETAITSLNIPLDGVYATDNVALSVSGTYSGVNVGEVTANVVIKGLSGPDSGNYILLIDGAESTGVALDPQTVNITPAPVTVTQGVADKTYNGTTDVTLDGERTLTVGSNVKGLDKSALSWFYEAGLISFITANVNLLHGSEVPVDVLIGGVTLNITAPSGEEANPVYDINNYYIDNIITDKETLDAYLADADSSVKELFEGLSVVNVYITEAVIYRITLAFNGDGIVVDNKYYDKSDVATVTFGEGDNYAVSGILASDAGYVTPDYTAIWQSVDVGNDIPVSVIINGLVGEKSNNYRFTQVYRYVKTGNIMPRKVTVSSISVNDKIYDGTSDATVGGYLLDGVIGGDSVSLVFERVAFGAIGPDGKFNPWTDVIREGGMLMPSEVVVSVKLVQDKANYSFYTEDDMPVSSIEDLQKAMGKAITAYIRPFEITLNSSNITVTPIYYKLEWDLGLGDNTISTQKGNEGYVIDYGRIPNNEYIYINVISATYTSLMAGTNVDATFQIGSIEYTNGQPTDNYVIAGSDVINVAAVIKPAEIIVEAANIVEVVYGSTSMPDIPLVYYDMNGDMLSADYVNAITANMREKLNVVTGYTSKKPVGLHEITFTGGTADNYSVSTIPGNYRIVQRTLHVSMDDFTVNKGTTVTNSMLQSRIKISGFVNGETQSVLTALPTAVLEDAYAQSGMDFGTYEIIISGGKAANYTFVYQNATLSVIMGTLTNNYFDGGDNKVATYNHGNPITMEVVLANNNYTVKYEYFTDPSYAGEPLNGLPTDVGVYYVKATVSAENYQPQILYGTLTINTANVTVSVASVSNVQYDGNAHTVSATKDAAVTEGRIIVTYRDIHGTEALQAVNAGTYTVTAYFLPEYVKDDNGAYVLNANGILVEYNSAVHEGQQRYSTNGRYNIATATGQLIINPQNIIVSIIAEKFIGDGSAKRVIYDASLPQGLTITEIYQKDSEIFTCPEGQGPTAEGRYVYRLQLAGDNASNYTLTLRNSTGNMVIGVASVSGSHGSISASDNTILSSGEFITITNTDKTALTNDQKIVWGRAESKIGSSGAVEAVINAYIENTDGSKTYGFDGEAVVAIDLPSGISGGSNIKVMRVNSDGTLTDTGAVFRDGKAVFNTVTLGDFVIVKENTDNTLFVYGIVGIAALLLAVAIIIICVKRAGIYRNMRAIVNAKKEIGEDDLD